MVKREKGGVREQIMSSRGHMQMAAPHICSKLPPADYKGAAVPERCT